MNKKARLLLLLTFIVGLARTFPFFLNPTLIAEEGQVFFAPMLRGSIEWINFGYLNLFPNLVLYGGYKLAPSLLPWICILAGGLVRVFSWSFLLSPNWERLLRLRWRYILVFLFGALGPCPEGHFALLYSFWFLGLGGFLIAFEVLFLNGQPTRLRALWMVVAILSGPVAPLLMFGLITAAILMRTSLTRVGWVFASTCVLSGLAQAYAVARYHEPTNLHLSATLMIDMVRALVHQANLRVLWAYAFSEAEVGALNTFRWAGYTSLLASLLFYGWLVRSALRFREFAVVLITVLIFSVLNFIGRPFLIEGFRSHPYGIMLVGERYSMVQQFLIGLVSAMALQRFRLPPVVKIVFAVVLIQARLGDFFITMPYRAPVSWHQVIQAINAKNGSEVPIVPEGWKIRTP